MPTRDEILEDLENEQASLFPRQKSMDIITSHYLLNSSIADALADVYVRVDEIIKKVDVMEAEGEDLDHLVADRLLEGRLLGEYATGFLTFYRSIPATSPITIPSGTVCYLVGSSGERIKFKTTSTGMIGIGEKTCSVQATAIERGLGGNVAMMTIVHIYGNIEGIEGVRNPLAFSGGTSDETDEELRLRYVDIINLPGVATVEMIRRHLVDLTDVTEAKVINYGNGDMEVVVDYSQGIDEVCDDITNELQATVSAGIQVRGCHAARVETGDVTQTIDPESLDPADCGGGFVWFRPLEHLIADDIIPTFNYVNVAGETKTGTITVSKGTHRGTMVQATLDDDDERAISIPSQSIDADYDYDILIGMGIAGYLYTLPVPVPITVQLAIRVNDTPEVDLANNIKESIMNWILDFSIGEDLEWSDFRTCVAIEYLQAEVATDRHVITGSERPFIGVDNVSSMVVVGKGEIVSSDGQTIVLEHDEIARIASVVVSIIS